MIGDPAGYCHTCGRVWDPADRRCPACGSARPGSREPRGFESALIATFVGLVFGPATGIAVALAAPGRLSDWSTPERAALALLAAAILVLYLFVRTKRTGAAATYLLVAAATGVAAFVIEVAGIPFGRLPR